MLLVRVYFAVPCVHLLSSRSHLQALYPLSYLSLQSEPQTTQLGRVLDQLVLVHVVKVL